MTPLLLAIALVESGNRELPPRMDRGSLAIGPWQIHPAFARDVGRSWARCRGREYAAETIGRYWQKYGARTDYERCALLQCGPNWRSKPKAAAAYYAKVRRSR